MAKKTSAPVGGGKRSSKMPPVEEVVEEAVQKVRQRVKWADYQPSKLDQPAIDWTKEHLRRMNLRAKHLAKHLGISQQSMSNAMCGKRRFKIVELREMAKFFGVPPPKFDAIVTPSDVVGVKIVGQITRGSFTRGDEDYGIAWSANMAGFDIEDQRAFEIKHAGASSDGRKFMDGDVIVCVPYSPKYLGKIGRKTIVVMKHEVKGHGLVSFSLALMTASSSGSTFEDVIGTHDGGEPSFIAIALQSKLA